MPLRVWISLYVCFRCCVYIVRLSFGSAMDRFPDQHFAPNEGRLKKHYPAVHVGVFNCERTNNVGED